MSRLRKKCTYCHKLNQWAKVWLTKKNYLHSKAIHTVDEEDDDGIPTFIDAITKGSDNPDTAYANIEVSTGGTVRFKLDTGAQAKVMPSSVYTRLRQKVPLQPSTSKLFGYTGKQLTVQGSIILDCSYKRHNYRGAFHIEDTPPSSQPILGLQACLQLELTVQGSITLDCSYKRHNDRGVFHILDTPDHTRPTSLSPAGAHQDDPVHRLLHSYDPRQRHHRIQPTLYWPRGFGR